MADMPAHPPLNIFHLTAGAVLGGVTRYICDLSTGIRQTGRHRVLAAGSHGPWQGLMTDAGIEWIDLPLDGGPVALWRSARAIADLVRERKIDLIHCHFRRPVLAARLARLLGGPKVPLIYTLHLAPLPLKGIMGLLSDFGDWVIAPSEEGRKWIASTGRVAPDHIRCVPHGVCADSWPVPTDVQRDQARRHFGIDDGRPVATFVGRFEGVKNEDWVLDLAEECRRLDLKSSFLICGDGPRLSEIKSRIERGGLREMVQLLGYIDPKEVYHASDLLLLPSRIEGFGYAAAEAACCGVAVLRTRTTGWQETVQDGVTGRVVDIDRDAFVRTAIEMLGNRREFRRMGANGARMVREHLTLTQQVANTLDVYRRAIAGRANRPS
ncbi:MAG: glycosyltransferase family 4 protein [Planctomycetia bacterium]|nr:glycosyltransferase family 4 protein [Planctomycetia bacterium]